MSNNRCILLFSGGSDSCLAALRLAEEYEQVVLLTMTRKGFTKLENVQGQVARLDRYYGVSGRFPLHFIPHDRIFRYMLYENYFHNLRKYGSMVLSHCGLCKVAMHWRGMVWAMENGITHVADGAVRASSEYPAQNERIMLRHLHKVYESFGLRYDNPVYEEPSTEQILYDLRFHRRLDFKRTPDDLQLLCDQQILYAMFMRHFRTRYSLEEFEDRMVGLYDAKLDMVEQMTREYCEKGAESKLAPLLEQEITV